MASRGKLGIEGSEYFVGSSALGVRELQNPSRADKRATAASGCVPRMVLLVVYPSRNSLRRQLRSVVERERHRHQEAEPQAAGGRHAPESQGNRPLTCRVYADVGRISGGKVTHDTS